MRTHFNPKNNPRVIIIQKLYGKFYNEENTLDFPKHRFKKFIKDIVLGTIERNELILTELESKLGNDFIFNEEQTENVNTNQDNVEKEYQANLDIIRKRGYNTTKQELGVDNESKKSWVQEQLNNIKQTTKNYTDLKNKYDAWNTKRPDMRNSEGDESLFYDIDTGVELDWNQVVESLEVNPDADPPMVEYRAKVGEEDKVIPRFSQKSLICNFSK